jgi:predicted ATPase/class 3 adenylate cyclase
MERTASFGYWLRRRRRALDLTQDELAQRVACALGTIKKIESDERRPSKQLAQSLADALEIPAAERAAFLKAARAELAVDQLDIATPLSESGAVAPPATLPAGTVTFLFTDIADSTRLWAQHPAAMRGALARHDAIVRAAIEQGGGRVFKTGGDAFHAVFADATGALAAALAAQRGLLAEPWPETGALAVRMALHSGTAELRDGDYFGHALNQTARILAASHGGQILLSAASWELTRDHLRSDIAVRDLGAYWLKGLPRPEQIYQVTAPELPADFPRLISLDRLTTNLPVPVTGFVGREREAAALRDLLRREDVRLVTLTGPGGTGKTRLSIQVAAALEGDFADGAWFVDLAPISDPELVPSAIAQALGVREIGEQPIRERLRDYLRNKRMLLLLDNFEQVVEAARAVGELLAAAPGLKLLATSRILLRLAAEHEFAVPPLGLPPAIAGNRRPALEHAATTEDLTHYEAVRLFIDRAQAAKAGFAVTNDNAPAVAEICYRLDGLPLAIELAAARVKLFAPQALLARLENGLGFLTGGARDLPARQQTIRNTIDWSYNLLSENEKRLFARLGVFVGGWTIEAAEAVCNWTEVQGLRTELPDLAAPVLSPQSSVLNAIAALADHSLVRQNEGPDGEPRFSMLETIREYALERLAASGEAEEMRRRHADYFLALAEEAEPWLRRAEQLLWFSRLRAERANLLAALGWALQNKATEIGLRLASALKIFWDECGPQNEPRYWINTLLVQSGEVAPEIRAKALRYAGDLASTHVGHDAAQALQRESLTFSRLANDRRGSAEALGHLAFLAYLNGDFVGMHARLDEAEPIYKDLNDTWGIASILLMRGLDSRAPDRSCALTEQSLALFRATGDRFGIGSALNNLGWAALTRGDLVHAAALFEEQHANHQQLHERTGSPLIFGNLGVVAHAQGELVRAEMYLRQTLRQFENDGNKKGCVEMIVELAWVANSAGNHTRATRLMAAATALHDAIGYQLEPFDQTTAERNLATARAALGTEAFEAAWAAGRTLPLDQAIAEALSVNG